MQSFSALYIRARFVFAYYLCYLMFPYCIKLLFLSFTQFSSLRSWRFFLKIIIHLLHKSLTFVIQVPPCKAPYKRTQHCWMLHVASVWTSCCMLLHVVGSCCIRLHKAANMDATTPTTVGQQCWGLLRPFVGSLREYQRVLLVESGILGFGIRNTAQVIRNPTYDWNPESKLHWRRSRIQ